jgi:membrane-associated protease RseP (regulator of RpoE activity)
MFVALAVSFLLATILLHELGHALAMRSRGIRVEETGLGFPVPKLPRIAFTFFRGSASPLRVVISPLLLGAYVRPRKEDIERQEALPYHDQALIFGAGVLANLLFGLATMATWDLLSGNIEKALVLTWLGAILWMGRKQFCSYFIPFLGAVFLLAFLAAIFNHGAHMGGPISIFREAGKTRGIEDAFKFGFAISLDLALLNMLPIYPLDGGRLMAAVFRSRPKVKLAFQLAGTLLVLTLFFGTTCFDIASLL